MTRAALLPRPMNTESTVGTTANGTLSTRKAMIAAIHVTGLRTASGVSSRATAANTHSPALARACRARIGVGDHQPGVRRPVGHVAHQNLVTGLDVQSGRQEVRPLAPATGVSYPLRVIRSARMVSSTRTWSRPPNHE